jgi:hypothetical protein
MNLQQAIDKYTYPALEPLNKFLSKDASKNKAFWLSDDKYPNDLELMLIEDMENPKELIKSETRFLEGPNGEKYYLIHS